MDSLKSTANKPLDSELHRTRVEVLVQALRAYSLDDIDRLEENDVEGVSTEDIKSVQTLLNMYNQKAEEFLEWIDIWHHDVARVLHKLDLAKDDDTASTSSLPSISPRSSALSLNITQNPIQPEESASSLWKRINQKHEHSKNKEAALDSFVTAVKDHPILTAKVSNMLNEPPRVYEDADDRIHMKWKRCDYIFRVNPASWTRVPSSSLQHKDVPSRARSTSGSNKRRRRGRKAGLTYQPSKPEPAPSTYIPLERGTSEVEPLN